MITPGGLNGQGRAGALRQALQEVVVLASVPLAILVGGTVPVEADGGKPGPAGVGLELREEAG